MSNDTGVEPSAPPSEVETIKANSRYLRGTISEGLQDPLTGGIAESDTALTKFHGTYQQDDRDLRDERRHQKLEPLFSFMIRVRVPGGICTPAQWLEMDRLAGTYANGSIRLTTRQAFQLHGVLKRHLKATIAEINSALMDTIAACGDVNRNVMCTPNPEVSALHREVYATACTISARLTPRTTAYHEIWLDGQRVAGGESIDAEPVYGRTYLPRKFKIAVAVPPSNDVDVYAHDLGFIAIGGEAGLSGFNVTVGGGMGMTHGEPDTYPRLADVIGYIPAAKAPEVAEAIVTIQRDFGDRTNRKHARFKYTIDDRGLAWCRQELETRLGWALERPRPFVFDHTGDRYGWVAEAGGGWHYTLFIENGRVRDTDERPLMSGLREIARVHKGDFRLTANQNLIIGNIPAKGKARMARLLGKFRLDHEVSMLRRQAMACVAFPTCGLAMAESERYLPSLLTKLEAVMDEAGLHDDPVLIRMTGCPNGCARPYLGEIGFVGKAPGRYNLYLGAGFRGDRLNKLYRENVNEEQIMDALDPLLRRYATERLPGERFGDFVIRAGVVKAVAAGKDFHA